MGEVYRALDTNLARQVAIKVLPGAVGADADRLARFDREAKTLASLNHPNIAAIYGLERSGPMTALVMELVEGPTLADRIEQGAIPVDEALPIAKQIGEALEAAHERGIIHRDLKPANIKVRPDGTVKVLDFGLAKATEPAGARSANVSMSPTITSPAMVTGVGMILGTAGYMSPEQSRGQAVDKRTDIWAFGCVLYEMLTSRAPFARDTLTDTLAAIVEREPDWTALPTVPPAITRLLHRCLEKDVRRRLHDIADARIEIEDAVRNKSEAIASPALARRTRASIATFVAGSLATALAAGVVGAWIGSRTVADVSGPSFTRILRLTSGPAREWAPAISPDGKWVAYLSN